MPNQRKEGKKRVGVWLTEEERTSLNKAAADEGYDNLADFFRHVIREAEPAQSLKAAEESGDYKPKKEKL